jgi:hypothetical protein
LASLAKTNNVNRQRKEAACVASFFIYREVDHGLADVLFRNGFHVEDDFFAHGHEEGLKRLDRWVSFAILDP